MTTASIDRIEGVRTTKAIKAPVRVATTANITLSGEQTIDTIAVVAGDRVLVRSQTDQTQNGIYDVAIGAWRRAKDFNSDSEITQGTAVFVASGALHGSTLQILLTASPALDVTALAFGSTVVIEGADNYLPLIGGTLTGQLNLDAAAARVRRIAASDAQYLEITPGDGNAHGQITGIAATGKPIDIRNLNHGTALARILDSLGVVAAQIEGPGTALSGTKSVVTREKGDARYALAGTTASIEGSYNATVTPSGSGSITMSVDEVDYYAIGDLVYVTGIMEVGSVSSPVGTRVSISLPFLPKIGINQYWTSIYRDISVGRVVFGCEARTIAAFYMETGDISSIVAGDRFYLGFVYRRD